MWRVDRVWLVGGLFLKGEPKWFRSRWRARLYAAARDVFYMMPGAFPTWTEVVKP